MVDKVYICFMCVQCSVNIHSIQHVEVCLHFFKCYWTELLCPFIDLSIQIGTSIQYMLYIFRWSLSTYTVWLRVFVGHTTNWSLLYQLRQLNQAITSTHRAYTRLIISSPSINASPGPNALEQTYFNY